MSAYEDESLKGLCDHWTEAQKGVEMNTGQNDRFNNDSRRPSRRRRRRRSKPSAKS